MPWFGKKSRKRSGQRSSILKRRTFTAERLIFWFKRGGFVLGALVFVSWVGSWFFLSGTSTRLNHWISGEILTATAQHGLRVHNVLVEGRRYTDADVIMAILNVGKGDPLFSLKPLPAQDMLEKLSWVESARVERRLPDTVYVHLNERVPMALWQNNQDVSLIDKNGVVITKQGLDKFKELILIVGEHAPEEAPEFFKHLHAEDELLGRIEAARLISKRRWDLKLKNGVVVKLPEDEIALALRRLVVLHEKERLMDKDVLSIDVRQSARITVRTKPGAVQEYSASFQQTL